MGAMQNLSLRKQLTLIIMLTTGTSLLLACLAVAAYDWFSFRQAMAHDLAVLAAVLGENSNAPLAFGDTQAATDVLEALEMEPHVVLACIYSKDGRVFAKYVRHGAEATAVPASLDEGTYFRPGKLIEFHHITLENELLGTIYIESDLQEMNQRLRRYTGIVAAVMLFSLLVAYLLASQLQRVVSRPILDLVRTARQVSNKKDYAVRAASSVTGELGQLVRSFNEMLEQIQFRDQELEEQRADLQAEVAARTLMNEQLETARATAEAASKAKGEFLANMSHEIRTPINGVLGMTELVLDTELTADQRDCLLMARSSGESLLGLINDILDFSRVESGRLQLDPIEFNLYNCVGETMKALALRAHQKGLELAYDMKPDVPQEVIGDPGRVRQVLVNLVGNAIKFTETGEVLVEVETLGSKDGWEELHFKVADTGIGIPEHKHKLLFQAFSQADSGTTRKYGGSGLGLAICARLVELMQGKIWLESAAGHGSTFHFTVRMARAPERALRSPIPEGQLKGISVLIADDNSTNRRILSSLARGWGMRVTAVESGQAALAENEAATRDGVPFRVIVLDACMPRMDGFQVVEQLRQTDKNGHTAILMLTSAGRPGEAARCRQLGIAAYLLKPVLKADLYAAILTVLGTQQTSAPQLVTRHTLRESSRKLRVLVAEDNAVNQALIVRVLAKLGHASVVATNGKEALSLACSQRFDLVFMDVQMPEMDGLAATEAIRQAEKATGLHLPIIAMTAYAMKGDRERCLQAGMDGYLAKPVRFSDIEAVLAGIAGVAPPPPAYLPAWRREEALERVDGDENFLQELCQIFLQESPRLLEKLSDAIATNDVEAMQKAAHSLKGELSYLAVPSATQAAKQLEEMGRGKTLAGASDVLSRLQLELQGLRAVIEGFVGAQI